MLIDMAEYKAQSSPRRIIPPRLAPLQLLKKQTAQVQQFEVQNLASVFMDLYRQKYGLKFVNLNRTADQTALRRIIVMCQHNGWPVNDFVEYNVLWYKQNLPYRPLPTNFCGQKAEDRYESFLRREGYITADAPVPTRRREEVDSIDATRERVRLMRIRQQLPEQAEEAAVEYANGISAGSTEPAKPPTTWIRYTREQLVELRKQQVWAEAKEEYMRRWREEVIYGRTAESEDGQF